MKSKHGIHNGIGNLQSNKGSYCIISFLTDTQITIPPSLCCTIKFSECSASAWCSIKHFKYLGDLLPELVAGTSFAVFHILLANSLEWQ